MVNLAELVGLIERECRAAVQYGIFGTSSFHIESVRRLPDVDGALNFEVVTFSRNSSNPREVEQMGLFDVMDLLGRIIGHRAVNDALEVVR